MNKKILTILIIIFLFLIITESIILISGTFPKFDKSTAHIAGIITLSDTSVTINDKQIPSYDFQNAVYVVAEDLVNHGFCINASDNGSLSIEYIAQNNTNSTFEYCNIPDNSKLQYFENNFMINNKIVQCYISYGYHIFPAKSLSSIAEFKEENNVLAFTTGKNTEIKNNVPLVSNAASIQGTYTGQSPRTIEGSNNAKNYRSPSNISSKIIVLDPGHGKSSSKMSNEEKEVSGYSYNESKGEWGEWRHWKSGTSTIQCEGNGCSKTHTPDGACWYPIGHGDRNTEPEINLNNALSAKKHLEQMGYIVRMTRTSNDENPSFSKRVSFCYPNNDNTQQADALLYVCIHANAGGGRGSAYISAEGTYDQKGIRTTYINDCNTLGSVINEKIISTTSLKKSGSGVIRGLGALIAFNKSPVTCGYLEIGYYDNANDLNILKNESDKIGKAIAEGIDEFVNGV